MPKMQKRVLIAVLVVLIIAVSGCRRASVDEPTEYNYRTGTEGLTLSFPSHTPTQIYENDNVNLMVEIRNSGAFPLTADEKGEFEGKIWIGGYDRGILTIEPESGQSADLNEDELEGKSSYNKDGGFSAVEFNMDAKNLPQGMPYYKPRIIVTASYFYKTLANPMICVDPEPRSTRVREKVCNVGDYSASGAGSGKGVGSGLGSQGAPIAVTKIEEDVTSNDILFKIYIQNSGNGLVISKDDIGTDPNMGYDWRDINKVVIESIKVGNKPMTNCRPKDVVQLTDGKGYIFCTLSKSQVGEDAYVTPLNIQLSYGYTTSIEKDIEIFEEVSFGS
ncbi:hypothetical protein KY366_04385 [Candidatus Woesearchaeota archaeon]|nr:hypothetical protein [Candidatus Woesearchaeota archaeon]